MSFVWGNSKISAKEFTIAEDDKVIRFIGKMPDGAIMNSAQPFVEFMVGAVIEGDAPLAMVTPDSQPMDIAQAYEAWLKLPRRFMRLWRQEVENAENPAPKA